MDSSASVLFFLRLPRPYYAGLLRVVDGGSGRELSTAYSHVLRSGHRSGVNCSTAGAGLYEVSFSCIDRSMHLGLRFVSGSGLGAEKTFKSEGTAPSGLWIKRAFKDKGTAPRESPGRGSPECSPGSGLRQCQHRLFWSRGHESHGSAGIRCVSVVDSAPALVRDASGVD